MVDIKTAIYELNAGKIVFDYKDDDCCTTEGEVVILLKRLVELDKTVTDLALDFGIKRTYLSSIINRSISNAEKEQQVLDWFHNSKKKKEQ